MESSKQFAALFTTAFVLTSVAAQAARVDMSDPRRALGREDDVRVDAQLYQDAISTSSPLTINYQIQNLSKVWIAIADKVSETSYDSDTRTVTLSVGAEIPAAKMPHIVVIAPGETKSFTAGGTVGALAPKGRNPLAALSGYVQIRVNILRDVTPFRDLIARQAQSPAPIALSDDMFDRWVDSNDSIFLNVIPVKWTPNNRPTGAEQRTPSDPASSGTW